MTEYIRIQIFPDADQKELIEQTFKACNTVYNKGLSFRQESYQNGKSVSFKQTCKMLTQLKKEKDYAYLKNIDSHALQLSLRSLDRAYQNFFNKTDRYPASREIVNITDQYRTASSNNSIKIVDGRIRLPKIGYVKLENNPNLPRIRSVIVERTKEQEYYVLLTTD